jgi:hypothetical protein
MHAVDRTTLDAERAVRRLRTLSHIVSGYGVQSVPERLRVLQAALRSHLSSRSVAVIIDGLWTFSELDDLLLPAHSRSSVLITSRMAHGGAAGGFIDKFKRVLLSGQSNRMQQEAMLACYVAQDPTQNVLPACKRVRSCGVGALPE